MILIFHNNVFLSKTQNDLVCSRWKLSYIQYLLNKIRRIKCTEELIFGYLRTLGYSIRIGILIKIQKKHPVIKSTLYLYILGGYQIYVHFSNLDILIFKTLKMVQPWFYPDTPNHIWILLFVRFMGIMARVYPKIIMLL